MNMKITALLLTFLMVLSMVPLVFAEENGTTGWLWITNAFWKLSLRDGPSVTGTMSSQRIARALVYLDGQKLKSVLVRPSTGATRLAFDLGAVLEVRRFQKDHHDDLWILYKPNGYSLAVNGQGSVNHSRGSTAVSEVRWQSLTDMPEARLTAMCRRVRQSGGPA